MFIQVNLLREKAQKPKNIAALRYDYKNIIVWILDYRQWYFLLSPFVYTIEETFNNSFRSYLKSKNSYSLIILTWSNSQIQSK